MMKDSGPNTPNKNTATEVSVRAIRRTFGREYKFPTVREDVLTARVTAKLAKRAGIPPAACNPNPNQFVKGLPTLKKPSKREAVNPTPKPPSAANQEEAR